MAAVARHAAAGGRVLGICNGFQVLTEARLLPGALRPNSTLQFRCHDAVLRVERRVAVAARVRRGRHLTIPMKHHDGCFFASTERCAGWRTAARCCCATSQIPTARSTRIAGVTNAAGNVAGLMPHPEHAVDELLGSTDGRVLLQG